MTNTDEPNPPNAAAFDRRTDNLQMLTTPAVRAAVDAYAAKHRWTRSTALEALVIDGLRRAELAEMGRLVAKMKP